MAKPSHGQARGAAKKKAKRRLESRSVAEFPAPSQRTPAPPADRDGTAGTTVLQFRPRAREAVDRASARPGGKSFFPAVDYSYVYTDLKIIGALSGSLFVGLLALSFFLH